MKQRIFPEHIRKTGIATLAKRPDETAIRTAVRLMAEEGIETVLAPHTFTDGAEDYFAADADTRTADFNSLLADGSIDLILAARGGYGSAYLADGIDWTLLRERNLPVLGYSDITALHMAMLANHAGIPVACAMAQQLEKLDDFSRTAMHRALCLAAGKTVPGKMCQLQPVSAPFSGAAGRLIPANLAVLASLCGTGLMPDFRNAVLLLEDIDEEPRKIDRMLLQLDLCGILKQCAAVLFGQFSGECGTEEERNRIFRRFAERNPGIPFLSGVCFGHELPSLAFVCGQPVRISADGILYY